MPVLSIYGRMGFYFKKPIWTVLLIYYNENNKIYEHLWAKENFVITNHFTIPQ